MDSPFQESQSRILKTITLDINALSHAGAQDARMNVRVIRRGGTLRLARTCR